MQCALELACIHMNVFARVAMSVGLTVCLSVRPSVVIGYCNHRTSILKCLLNFLLHLRLLLQLLVENCNFIAHVPDSSTFLRYWHCNCKNCNRLYANMNWLPRLCSMKTKIEIHAFIIQSKRGRGTKETYSLCYVMNTNPTKGFQML